MRRAFPSGSRDWWAVVLCALSAVIVFMAFEVLDLDGSDLQRRIFQPPISSRPTLAESEGAMRQGAFMLQDALGVLKRHSPALSSFWVSASPRLYVRLTSIRPRGSLRHASFPLPPAIDDPHLRFGASSF